MRTAPGFEQSEKQRYSSLDQGQKNLRFKLRIVCTEGAVLRDGIEIDSASALGSMEMGEVVVSTDRCINVCGILR